VDFTLSDEQELLRETAAALFDREFPSELVRAAAYDRTEDGPALARAAFDAHLRDWFVLGDASVVEQCLFLQESGRAVLTGPLWSSSALALPVLRAAGAPQADDVASGTATATVALAGRDGRWVPNGEPTKCFVPDAGSVDMLVVVAGEGTGPGGLDGATATVLDAAGVDRREVANLDRSRPLFEVTPPSGAGALPVDPDALRRALQRATVALAAELVGVARWLREATLDYVRHREQFGRPVGSFQGLQWKLVDAALAEERAAAAMAYAAMCLDAEDPDRHDAVHVAKAAAGAAARRWATDGLQAHGGIGYTWEHDLHLRLRRAQAADHLLGDADWHRDHLATSLFDEEPVDT
jgi:alkylation response protein AidB-like acyl-CoA dehydrogenase